MQRQVIIAQLAVSISIGGCAAGSISTRYGPTADRIIRATMKGNDSYRKMEELCDGIGHRLSGSAQLEQAVAWAAESMKNDGQENVHSEPVMVPKWVRGQEWAKMVAPREAKLAILGLGMSVGTSSEGITAPVVCVRDEAEFEALGDAIAGKIVLFNNPMPAYDSAEGAHYGTSVRFRGKGPSMAAAKGAVACLVRAVTAHSLRSPHTGSTRYDEAVAKIPAAAVSVEDAEMIARLLARGEEVRIQLKMEARLEGESESANVIGELRGFTRPEEVVVIGGHIDSWDVGQGAHDDATGCVMAMEAINVLRKLNLRPRRTIRVVLWTNEENGLRGARNYAEVHADELGNHVAAIESDSGGFAPRGFGLDCADDAKQTVAVQQIREIMALLKPFGVERIDVGFSGADLRPMRSANTVLMGVRVDGTRYFDYHHSEADTLDKVNPEELSQCVATMAVVAYVIADMPERLGETAAR